MVQLRTTIVLILMAVFTAQSQTYIAGGDISGNWNASGSPYIIEGNLTIGIGERLKIYPGVEVVFTGPYAIEVFGRLEATGSVNDSIYFTVQDTTGYASGNFSNNWYGIGFLNYANNHPEISRLEYCNIEFSAGSGITCLHFNTLRIKHSTFRYNQSHGIHLMEFSDIMVENSVVENNGSTGFVVNFSAPQVSEFIIRNNGNGGLSIAGSPYGTQNPTFINGGVYNNNSNTAGGGIFVSQEVYASFTGLEVYSNSAQLGGGIFGSSSSIILNQALISGNSANQGGGIYMDGTANLTMQHTLVSFNTATQNGGGIANNSANINADRCTFANNSAGNSGGGLYYQIESNTNNTITNSIIWENYPDAVNSVSVQPVITYSNVMGGFYGKGNMDADPLFADPGNNDFNLTWAGFPVMSEMTSPCIDSGNPLSETDPDQTIADMGAFYFEQIFITSIQNKTNETMITIYPNPATHLFVIEGSNAIEQVNIINLSGQMVRTFDSINSEYHIADLNPGVYLIQIMTNNGNVATRKLVKN